jgi:hypothetical protein
MGVACQNVIGISRSQLQSRGETPPHQLAADRN